MAFNVEEISIDKNRILAPLSRYVNSKIFKYGLIPKITFETYKRKPAAIVDDGIVLITAGWEYRPDLVSFDIYGFPDLWWKIMEFNGIFDVMDFKAGKTIKIPRMS